MNILTTYTDEIRPLDGRLFKRMQREWDSIAKPLDSFGAFEKIISQIAVIQAGSMLDISKRALVVMCADNGVVAQGVSQTDERVTTWVTEALAAGEASVSHLAACAKVDVVPVNMACLGDPQGEGIKQVCLARGTNDFTQQAAMSYEQALEAILCGIETVQELKAHGYNLIATGEMGIGNTTSASAVVSVLLEKEADEVAGVGAGLSHEGLQKKIGAIKEGIARNNPCAEDPVEVLAKVGGYDIAGLCGVFLGAAFEQIPVIIDGYIAAVAALCAKRICPAAGDYMIASHESGEPAAKMCLDALNLEAVIQAKMRLGEGTGAMMLIPLLDMALYYYRNMTRFETTTLDAYEPLI